MISLQKLGIKHTHTHTHTEVGIRLTKPQIEAQKPIVQDWPTLPPCITPSHSSEETNSTEENLGSIFSKMRF